MLLEIFNFEDEKFAIFGWFTMKVARRRESCVYFEYQPLETDDQNLLFSEGERI